MRWTPDMGPRLDALRRRARVRQDELAEQAGIPRATLQRILGGKAVPDEERYAAMLRVLDATDADVRLGDQMSDIVEVPIYDIEVAAGPGRFLDNETPIGAWPFPREWIVSRFGIDRDLALLRVSGDSQEPELRSGDSVMIDLRLNRIGEGMYVVRLGDALVIKRIVPTGMSVRLVSANPAYRDVIVEATDAEGQSFSVVGKAVWAGKLL